MAQAGRLRPALRSGLSFLIFFLGIILRPAALQVRLERVFVLVVLGLVKDGSLETLGQEFLVHEVPRIIVGVLVTIRITKLFHQLGWSIP